MRHRIVRQWYLWLSTAFAAVIVTAGCAGTSGGDEAQAPKNIIILFADGAAGTQWDFGRYTGTTLRKQSFATTEIVFRQGALGLATTSRTRLRHRFRCSRFRDVNRFQGD